MIPKLCGNKGTVLILFAVTSLAVITAVGLSIDTGAYLYDRSYTEEGSDAISLSLATVEARGLNTIAYLNVGMVEAVANIRRILLVWAASLGAAISGHPAYFFTLTRKAPEAIRRLWALGVTYSKTARSVRDRLPPILLAYLGYLLNYYKLSGTALASFPELGKKPSALSLLLKDGEPLTLTGIIQEAKSTANSHRSRNFFKKKFARMLRKLFFHTLKKVLRLRGSIIPQVLMSNFQERQRVIFTGTHGKRKPFFIQIFEREYSNVAYSAAQPFGGTAKKGTWRSRLIEVENPLRRKASRRRN